MKRLLKDNGLSIVFFILFLFALTGQMFTGLMEHNSEMKELGGETVGLSEYLTSGHFLQATFENWESEFLQMALFVVLTIFLFQKGSSESKDPEGNEPVDRPISARRKNVPWPVKKGGLVLTVYKHSLSIILFVLFILSFWLHLHGSLGNYNQEKLLQGEETKTTIEYLSSSRLWFESFQNWQSEFLSVFAIVVLSIFFREHGSAQSKPVDAPDSQTGE